MSKLFGTDGIRGEGHIDPITAELAFNPGKAIAHAFQTKDPGS